ARSCAWPPAPPSCRCANSSNWANSIPRPSSRPESSSIASCASRTLNFPAERVGTMLNRLSRDDMARRLAADIPAGSYVNIGIGMPELVAHYLDPAKEIILHSENGILGMGPQAPEGEEDLELINAGKKPVTLLTGGAFFDHVTSFAMMRGGHLDICIMGGMQVSGKGDLANWNLGRPGEPPAVGGAMDL